MKKVFWIFSFCALSFSTAFSQDDTYYTQNNSNNNSYNNQPAPPQADNSGYDNNNAYANNNQSDYQTPPSNDNQNYQSFHNQLSPYGNWVNYQGYGNVWVPAQVPADFSPYASAGHWAYTDYGWNWVSDYAWGGIPFHYGRWFRDNAYGWMWMPGYQWASAWVTWGDYDNYYCWAPLAPYVGFSAYYRPDPFCWNFVDRGHFCDYHLGSYLANRSFYGRGDFRGIAGRININSESRMYGNRSYFSGPRVNEVEHAVGHSISPVNHNRASHVNGYQMNAHNNNAQFHQSGNMNQYRGQNFANHNNVQTNHFANNNMQSQMRAQQYNRSYANTSRPNYGGQAQRSYNQPSRQNYTARSYQAPQTNFQRSQPVQRQTERNFASAQRSQSHTAASRSSSGGGSRGGRR